MPDAGDTTSETLAAPAPGGDAAGTEDTGAPNLWLAGLFVIVVVLVSLQNLWLRRRAERENASIVDND